MIPREVEQALGHFGAAAMRCGSFATRSNDDRWNVCRAALVAAIERAIEQARNDARDYVPGTSRHD